MDSFSYRNNFQQRAHFMSADFVADGEGALIIQIGKQTKWNLTKRRMQVSN